MSENEKEAKLAGRVNDFADLQTVSMKLVDSRNDEKMSAQKKVDARTRTTQQGRRAESARAQRRAQKVNRPHRAQEVG